MPAQHPDVVVVGTGRAGASDTDGLAAGALTDQLHESVLAQPMIP